jgi:hypothetical protein
VEDDVTVYRAVLPVGILPVEITPRGAHFEARNRDVAPSRFSVGTTPERAVRLWCEHREIGDPPEILAPGMAPRAELTARANEAHDECLRLRGLIDARATAETSVANRALSRVATLEARVAELEALYREAHKRGANAMLEAVLAETSDDGWGEHIHEPERDNDTQRAVRKLRVSHDPPEGVTRGG